MGNGLHNRVNKRLREYKSGRFNGSFYEKYYAELKDMLGYLLECGYVPLAFEKEHELETEFEELRKIWKTIFRIPYLEIRGYNKYRCPEGYKLVYRRWVNYLKKRMIQIRTLYLTEVIAECIHEDIEIEARYLYSYNEDITKYVNEKVWPSSWIQEYNKKFSVARELEEK